MSRRRIEESDVRKLVKLGGKSIAVTIPIELVRELGWREKQRVVVKLDRKKIVISDWKK